MPDADKNTSIDWDQAVTHGKASLVFKTNETLEDCPCGDCGQKVPNEEDMYPLLGENTQLGELG